jgi:LysR family hydrogen peroxide-inducible transcriptional activator
MEIHQLRYFIAVSEERSFSRAAERVRVSQPSLSQQIQKLETEVGRPLFDRLSRRVNLTAAGHGFLPHARKILSQLNDAQRFVKDYEDEPRGVVRLGVIPTIAPYVLRPLFEACAGKFPCLSLRIIEDVTDNLIRATANGEVDLAVISTCRPGPGMALEFCLEEPLLAAVPANHLLASKEQVQWHQLRKQPMLMLHESHCLAGQIKRWCAEHKIPIRQDVQTTQLSSLLSMVATGRGISLIPAMAAAEGSNGCAFLTFGAAAPKRDINLLRNAARYQSKGVSALGQLVREILQAKVLPR